MEFKEKYFADDEMMPDVIKFLVDQNDDFSTVTLQRQFLIGYNRALKFIGWLEKYGFAQGCSCTKFHLTINKDQAKTLIERLEIVG